MPPEVDDRHKSAVSSTPPGADPDQPRSSGSQRCDGDGILVSRLAAPEMRRRAGRVRSLPILDPLLSPEMGLTQSRG
jgi:hypothetical protein